jgi:hypothetical protein
MPKTIIPLPLFLPLDSVKLGRFVTSIDQPHEAYHEPSLDETPEPIKDNFFFTGGNENDTSTRFWSALTTLMSTGFSKRAKSQIHIAPVNGRKYSLDNSDKWFEKAVGDTETRKWIEKAALRGDEIYMIVGIVTLSDARITAASAEGRQVGGAVRVPVELSLAAVSAVVPFAGLFDPSLHGSYQGVKKAESQFVAPGEKVCALQYRKIPHKWLSSRRRPDLSRLEKSRLWFCMEGNRRNMYDDEDEDDEDMIEVDFQDIDDLDGEWAIQKVSGGDIVCICCN